MLVGYGYCKESSVIAEMINDLIKVQAYNPKVYGNRMIIKSRWCGCKFFTRIFIELFDLIEDKLTIVGNGLLPQGIMVGFPLDENEDDMKSYFITGDSDIDNAVIPVLNKYSNEELRKIWDVYMLDFSGTNSSLLELEYLHFKHIDKVVLIYAALQNIFKGKMK